MVEPSDRLRALVGERRRAVWCYAVVALLGGLAGDDPVQLRLRRPAGASARAGEVAPERGLSPVEDRVLWLTVNDVVCGVGLVILAAASLRARWLWAPWATCLLGVWIAFAPFAFWAPAASAYANETIVGALVIGLTLVLTAVAVVFMALPDVLGLRSPEAGSTNPGRLPRGLRCRDRPG